MTTSDLIVAGVSAGLGIAIIVAAIADSDWCFHFRLGRFAAARWGRGGARIACGFIGLALIALGGMIAFHYPAAWPWEIGG